MKQLAPWDPALGKELGALDLSAGAADPERSRRYVEHRLRQELAVPALRRSTDPVLRKLASELERISSFDENPIAHLNLKMGPLEPQACRGCDTNEVSCNEPRCERELGFAAPAVISAAGLDRDADFEGHPIATSEGVTTTASSGLSDYLQVVEGAGIAHDTIRAVLTDIVKTLQRRSAILEGRLPLVTEPGEPPARAVLRSAFERWRATYAVDLPSPTWPALSGDALDIALLDAYLASEGSLYQAYRWPRIAQLQGGRSLYYRKQLALMRAERAGKEPVWESSEPPSDEEACLQGPPVPSRQCAEVEAACATFVEFASGVPGPDEKPEAVEKAAADLALAFERLTLAGFTPKRIAEFLQDWMRRAERTSNHSL